MEDFEVIGYDAAGAELFRVTVPAITDVRGSLFVP